MRKKSGSFTLFTVGYAVLGEAPSKIFPFSNSIRVSLRRAGLKTSYVPYISSMVFWTLIAFITAYLVGVFFITHSFTEGFFVGGLGAVTCLGTLLYYPIYVATAKGRRIDKSLVYIANYMSIMANAGTSIEQIFRSLAEFGDLYGVKDIARDVIRGVELLGQDIVASLEEAATFSPSQEFSKLLQGFIATMKTGGSLSSYLAAMSTEYIEYRRRFLSRLIEQLNLAGEIYVSALVALPIVFITMFSIMGFLGGNVLGGLSSAQLMPFLIYFFIPLLAIAVILYIGSILSNW